MWKNNRLHFILIVHFRRTVGCYDLCDVENTDTIAGSITLEY